VEHPCLWADKWLYQTDQIQTIRIQIEPPAPSQYGGPQSQAPLGQTQVSLAAEVQRRFVESAQRCSVNIVLDKSSEIEEFPRIGLWSEWFTGGHSTDVAADVCGFIMPQAHPKVILGSGRCLRIVDVWREIARQYELLEGERIEIQENAFALSAFDMRSCALSSALSSSILGYQPKVSIAESIQNTMRFLIDELKTGPRGTNGGDK
jgi:hypothetical protein